jgi:hypothetical protein
MAKKHVCGLECISLRKGRLYHACPKCKHGSVVPINKSKFATKLTAAQKTCAAKYVPEMLHEQHRGRWKTRKQAIAVGLSKARSHC